MGRVYSRLAAIFCIVLSPTAGAQPPSPKRLDRHGDPLPAGAVARLGTDRYCGAAPITSLGYSSDGKLLASASGDMAVRVWDVAAGRERHRFFLGWGPGGVPTPRDRPVAPAVALRPDGRILAGSGADHKVLLWDTATGRERACWASGAGAVTELAFAPDGKTLAGACADGSVRLWDAATGRQCRCFDEHAGKVQCFAFAPDGRTLALGGADNTLRLWDVAADRELRQCKGHARGVRGLVFVLGGKQLASLDGANTVRLWDVGRGREIQTLTISGAVHSLARGYEGRSVLVVTEKVVQTWAVLTGENTSTISLPELARGGRVVLAPDGKTLAVGESATVVDLLRYPSGELLRCLGGGDPIVFAMAFAPGGKVVTTGTGGGTFHRRGNSIRLWDLATAREVRRMDGLPASIRQLAFSPDGKTLASAGADRIVRLWDPATGKELHRCAGHQDHVEHLAFAPDGKTLASAGQDRTVRLWDVATGKLRALYRGHQGPVWGLAFAPNGNRLATRSDRVCIWDLGAGREHSAGGRLRLAALWYAADGRLLALEREKTDDDVLFLWDVARESKLRRLTLSASSRGQLILAVSPDGRTVATAGHENDGGGTVSIRLWEVATGGLRRMYQGHEGFAVEQLAFSVDGRLLASASNDSTVLVWDVYSTPGRKPASALTSRELDELWDGLAAYDAWVAFGSMKTLIEAPDSTLALLRKKLRPVPRLQRGRLARLIADLDNDEFFVRKKATEELRQLGETAEGALRRSLENKPPLEVRMRAEALLRHLERQRGRNPPGERLRMERALEVLEQLHTPAARRLLEALAEGEFEAPRTHEARLALRRLPRR